MFGGGFGGPGFGGGFGGPPKPTEAKATVSFGGFPGMGATTHTTHTTTTSHHGTGGGHEDPGKKSKDMQERYRYREDKLLTYSALVDLLEMKGENVVELRKSYEGSKLTSEESAKGMKVFAKVSEAMMSFDFMKIMQ